MTARSDPKDYPSAAPADRRVVDDVLAEASAAIVNALADKWTSWRRELGFEKEQR
jgi:hypothetical protein